MRRGELYRVSLPRPGDPRRSRVYLIVSRQALIDSSYTTVVCVPVYSNYHGASTQVEVDESEGLKHHSSLHCDNLTSLPKTALTDYVGSLTAARMREVDRALAVALALNAPN
ncbi:MAG: type II toxin-antitoxin system PemK/MazF family toxin [Chloroflexi bacterium]|nr:type II toxin-antitoxin system PemK/MazF family toxin [Chloroflexota bacterium]